MDIARRKLKELTTVETTLSPATVKLSEKAMECIARWKNDKTIREVVDILIAVGDEALLKAQAEEKKSSPSQIR